MLHVSATFKREYTLDLFFNIILDNIDHRLRGYSLYFLLHNYATFNILPITHRQKTPIVTPENNTFLCAK